MTVIENGRIVTENEVLENCTVVIEKDRIAELLPSGRRLGIRSEDRRLDAAGGYVMPGFVDIHSDYIETVASPRPTALMDFETSVHEAQRMLMVHGITTIYHSLSLIGADAFSAKSIRHGDNIGRMIANIAAARASDHLIRNKLHLRFEIDNAGKVEELRNYLESGVVDLLSFMDHTPGQGQYRSLETYCKTVRAYNNMSEAQLQHLIEGHMNKEVLTLEAIRELAKLAQDKGIVIASHDDDSVEKVDLIHDLGFAISEFPITPEAAKEAKRMGMFTVGGSPNVLLGASHSGNLNIAEAILENAIDILCSDYYPAALLQSVFKMVRRHRVPLAEMVAMVSLNPAKAVKLDHTIGSIEPGKKADVLIVREIDSLPYVATCMVDGNVVFRSMYRRKEGALS
jgi:alpha-D-ribose 1-methylphosphonate 5-triphosphate diphosphatase